MPMVIIELRPRNSQVIVNIRCDRHAANEWLQPNHALRVWPWCHAAHITTVYWHFAYIGHIVYSYNYIEWHSALWMKADRTVTVILSELGRRLSTISDDRRDFLYFKISQFSILIQKWNEVVAFRRTFSQERKYIFVCVGLIWSSPMLALIWKCFMRCGAFEGLET